MFLIIGEWLGTKRHKIDSKLYHLNLHVTFIKVRPRKSKPKKYSSQYINFDSGTIFSTTIRNITSLAKQQHSLLGESRATWHSLNSSIKSRYLCQVLYFYILKRFNLTTFFYLVFKKFSHNRLKSETFEIKVIFYVDFKNQFLSFYPIMIFFLFFMLLCS